MTPNEDSRHETPAPAQNDVQTQENRTDKVTQNTEVTKRQENAKKSVLPNTGDTATVSSVLGTIGTILVALGIRKKKK